MSHYYGDTCAGGHWIGAWARAEGESSMHAHTLRHAHPKGGYVTFCGVHIERPVDEFAPMATDCHGCRSRRDR